jgi:ParB/RepB/Spo0J family partition protein
MAKEQSTQDAAPMAAATMRMLAVSAIEESLTNPRTQFDQVKLAELAASIAASGVHQPILVRPLPGTRLADTFGFRRAGEPLPTHELVAGARRLRACRMAKVAEIPVMIRDLTDDQVLEIQIVENLQRDDLSELEEAEGYERLMQHSGLSAEAVGAKIGKSKSYVYARLKLTALCTEARAALREGKLDASKALLIARIPDHTLQVKALKIICNQDYYGQAMSHRQAAEYVQHEFMLRLDAARFKIADATLVPDAGSCRECTKRTGYEPELFADVKSADTCTDPVCFHRKEDAHVARMREEAHERGQTIIEGREAKALMPSSWSSVEGYLRLDDKRDSPADKPLRKLIGKQLETAGIQPTLIANPHKDGELIAVLPAATVTELLKAQGHDEAADKVAKEQQEDTKAAQRKAQADQKRAYEDRWRWEVLTEAWKRTESREEFGAPDQILRHAARHYASLLNVDQAKRLCKLLDLGKVAPKDGVQQFVDGHEDPGAALMLLIAFRDVGYAYWREDDTDQNRGLMLVAAECEVDIEAIKASTKANMRAEAKLEAEREAAKAEKALRANAPAAPAAGGAGGKNPKAKTSTAKTPPAAPAGVPKTSKAKAAADIAAALQAAEGPDQGGAAAPQGDEAHPRLRADAAPSAYVVGDAVRFKDGLKTHGGLRRKVSGRAGTVDSIDEASGQMTVRFGPRSHEVAVATATELERQSDWPFPPAGKATAAEEQLGLAVGFVAGQRVEINDTASGRGAKYRGRLGVVGQKQGDRAYMVTITGRNGGLAKSVSFDETELMAVEV